MLRWLSTPLLVLALVHAAGAASLSVGTDKLTYHVGETVTVTVFGDDGPPVFGYPIVTYQIYGRLDYNGALVDNGTRSQTKLVASTPGDPGSNWVLGKLEASDDGTFAWSEAFDQLVLSAQTAVNLPGLLSTVTLIAAATGIVDLTWHTADLSRFNLRFFGLVNAPGASFTIVPEPASGVLLALGLLGILHVRRARHRSMPRGLSASVVAIALAHAAGAASLSVGTDKLTYAVGETVTVTVFGDDGPPSFGYPIVTYGIYGRLDYNGALVNTGTRSQSQLVGEHGNWIKGVLTAADTNAPTGSFSEAFNTIPFQGNPDTALNLPGTLSTVTLIAAATGIVDLTWHTADLNVFSLTFFGLVTAPGATFTIVPEAGTGALLALALLDLAQLRRAQR
jgi:hypothetical protein